MTKARDLADLLDASGNIIAQGTIDGRDIASDGSKLDSIEHGATGDQTHSEIRSLIVAGVDTNVFTDADHTKLDGIEAGATADQTAAEIRSLVESATDSNVFTDADHSKLNAIESGATADQTKSDIDALNVDADTLDGQHGSYYTNYTDTEVANLVASAPGTLDTLNELAAALGDDPNFATTTATNIGTKANKTITVSAGSGLTGGGDLTANRTISHADTSTVSDVNGSGNTFIQDIGFDTYGHVTSVGTGTVTVGDGAMTVTAGSGLSGGGQLGTANQSGASSVTVSHADTSSQVSVDNSNGTVIQDITLDTYGHITGIASTNLDGRYYTESEADSRFVNVTGDTMTGSLTVSGTITATGNIYSRNGDNSDIVIGEHPSYTSYGAVWLDGENDYRFLADPGGGTFINAIGSGHIYFRNDNSTLAELPDTGGLLIGGSTAFHDSYHPNADKWTTARTLSLTGDASGSVSWDGSGNATLSVAVNNIDGNTFVNSVSGNAVNADTIASNGISYYTGGVTNFSGNATDGALYSQQYSNSWQHQIAGDYRSGQIAVRGKNNNTWQPWYKVWSENNDGSGSGLDADLLDGYHLTSQNRNNQANRVVRTQSSGYCEFGWINTTSGNTTGTLSDIYVNTNDGYIRKATLAHVASQLPIDAGAPAGSVIYHAGSSAPSGYIKANGASLSTSTYSALFSAIGYTYGGSGGSFNVPDLRGEFIRGWDDSRGVDSGRSFASFQSDDFGSHTHTAYGGFSSTWFAVYARSGNWGSERFMTTNSYQTASTGSADTRPRNIALLACIKT